MRLAVVLGEVERHLNALRPEVIGDLLEHLSARTRLNLSTLFGRKRKTVLSHACQADAKALQVEPPPGTSASDQPRQ